MQVIVDGWSRSAVAPQPWSVRVRVCWLRTRAAMSAVLALAIAPEGFTVADLAAKVRSRTGGPTVRAAWPGTW